MNFASASPQSTVVTKRINSMKQSQPVTKFRAFYVTKTSLFAPFLSHINSVCVISYSLGFVLILSSRLHLSLPRSYFPSGLPTNKHSCYLFILPHASHVPFLGEGKITKLLTMEVLCPPLMPKHLLQRSIL